MTHKAIIDNRQYSFSYERLEYEFPAFSINNRELLSINWNF